MFGYRDLTQRRDILATRKTGSILIVDDDDDVLQAALLLLKRHFPEVRTESDPGVIPELLAGNSFDVILLDMNFTHDTSSGREGFHWLDKILDIDPSAVVILITAYGGVEMAVKAIRSGATDFVLKPWQNAKLVATISAGVDLRQSRTELTTVKIREKQLSADLDRKFHDFIGTSEAIRRVFDMIEKVAATDANVLILGENGTGKELAAREIHRQSGRSGEVFIAADMGAISETLFESELFGHRKGAFTDAREDRAGRFEMANGGTLFLDEIGNLPLFLQPKLLSVLNDRTVTRVGSNKPLPIDIRLICATNLPIYDMVAENRFRQDLLYRVNTVEITLPPLRERAGDIRLLAGHFLELYGRKYKKESLAFQPATLKLLETYGWPGNIRELRHAVERAVIMSEAEALRPKDFFLTDRGGKRGALTLASYNLDEVEQTVIRKALAKHDGNVSYAARELGLTRASLYRRMRKYGL